MRVGKHFVMPLTYAALAAGTSALHSAIRSHLSPEPASLPSASHQPASAATTSGLPANVDGTAAPPHADSPNATTQSPFAMAPDVNTPASRPWYTAAHGPLHLGRQGRGA